MHTCAGVSDSLIGCPSKRKRIEPIFTPCQHENVLQPHLRTPKNGFFTLIKQCTSCSYEQPVPLLGPELGWVTASLVVFCSQSARVKHVASSVKLNG